VITNGPGGQTQDSRAGRDGRFELPTIAAGTVLVEAWMPGFGRTGPQTVTVTAGGSHDIKLILQPSLRLSGMVVNEQGDPVSGARIQVGREVTEWRTLSATTDEDGRFTVDGLDEAAYWVSANFPGYAGGLKEQVRPPREDVRVTVWRKGGIKGQVQSASGAPIKDFIVTIERFHPIDGATREDGTKTRFTSSAGAFEMAERAPGRYDLVVGAAGHPEQRLPSVEVKPGGWATIAVTLQNE
jgi:hypothetical protein